jgi:outer membrane protein OmpA-like peptidoglycan-associated protein
MRRLALAIGVLAAFAAVPAMAEEPTLMPGGQLAQVPSPPPLLWSTGWNGLYVGVEGGADLGHLRMFAGPLAPAGFAGNTIVSRGFDGGLGGGTLGYNWQVAPSWLVGVEGDFSWVGRTVTGPSVPPFNPLFSEHFSENFLSTLRGRIGWTPSDQWLVFATGGAAVNKISFTDFVPTIPAGTASQSDTTWGWTAGAGAEMKINDSWSVKLEYLYVGMPDRTYFNPAPINAAVTFANDQKLHLSENIVRVGLNYHFGAPPPVVEPAAVPAPPPIERRVFLVFFDWDRDTITPQGEAIIQQAAAAYRAGAPVRLVVTGYTDRSGSPGYNQRLSERRANNVANALMHLGVPHDQMAVSGRGENDNRVPTAPGVREPQNRRVEIVFA